VVPAPLSAVNFIKERTQLLSLMLGCGVRTHENCAQGLDEVRASHSKVSVVEVAEVGQEGSSPAPSSLYTKGLACVLHVGILNDQNRGSFSGRTQFLTSLQNHPMCQAARARRRSCPQQVT
jgi:hypothetical protein